MSFAVIGSVLAELPTLTIAGAAMLTGLRCGELFPLCWKALDFTDRQLTVQKTVYESVFGDRKRARQAMRAAASCLQTVHFRVTFGNERTYTS